MVIDLSANHSVLSGKQQLVEEARALKKVELIT